VGYRIVAVFRWYCDLPRTTKTKESRNASNGASGCGPKDKMVKSKSGSAPHLVKITGNCYYICDGSCMQFKSLNICSHTLAAAHISDDVDGFIVRSLEIVCTI